MLKIAVDTGPLKSGDSIRGIGVYVRELTKALQENKKLDVEVGDVNAVCNSPSTNKDCVIHLTRFNPFVVSVPKKPEHAKFVLTIYDLIPLIYPKHYPAGIKGFLNWQINKHLIKKNVDAIITISETSKKDICRFIGISPSVVHPIYLAPRAIFKPIINRQSLVDTKKKYSLPDSFALYVGDINYNKNIPLLVEACKLAGTQLVICGQQAKNASNLDLDHPELVHLKGLDLSGVMRLGFVPDSDLVKIYNLASVYIQPSLYEGFGLPILEANAVGLPVVAAKTQALVEIAESSALFADPRSVKDFAEKIRRIMKDRTLRDNLIKNGISNAAKYTWEKTAEETSTLYEKI